MLDVIIPVHNARRPVERAVTSALTTKRPDVNVLVVLHGISPAAFPSLRSNTDGRLRIAEFADGIPSPAGPRNFGITLSDAKYLSFLDSDDYLAPGAIDRWLDTMQRDKSELLLAGLQTARGDQIPNPLVRPWRRAHLDPVKDRLFSRAAPLGLIRRSLIEQLGARYVEGLRTGEDIEFTARLIAGANRISTGRQLPPYVIADDATDRVTSTTFSMHEILQPVVRITGSEWFTRLPIQQRRSLITSRVKGSVLAVAAPRTSPSQWTQRDLATLSEFLAWVYTNSPESLAPLPRSQRDLLDDLHAAASIVSDGSSAGSDLAAQSVITAKSAGRWEQLAPKDLRYLLHREATLVRYVRYALQRIGA